MRYLLVAIFIVIVMGCVCDNPGWKQWDDAAVLHVQAGLVRRICICVPVCWGVCGLARHMVGEYQYTYSDNTITVVDIYGRRRRGEPCSYLYEPKSYNLLNKSEH